MSLKPEYYKEKPFEIINYNTEFFYPDENKQNGLDRLIIFRERTIKHSIPNGSVWYYNKNKDYNPDILGDDIGCGVTMSLLTIKHSTDIQNDDFVRDVMKVVSEMDVHLGQGNHFLNFMPHCLFENKKVIDKENNKYTLFLHTDFNNERIVPKTIDEAINMISNAKSKRTEYLMKLTNRLGFKGEIVNDFTHNTVRIEGDSVIYAKGCINVNDSGQSGVLLVNPVIGLVYYTSDLKKTYGFMQHGVSMLKKQNYYNAIPKLSYKKIRGYLAYRLLENTRKKCLNECEEDLDYFNEKFQSEFERMKYVQLHFIVRTKG